MHTIYKRALHLRKRALYLSKRGLYLRKSALYFYNDSQWAFSVLLSHYSTTSSSHGCHSNESCHPRKTDIIHEWRFGALRSHDSTTSTSHVPYQRHGSHVDEVMSIIWKWWYTCVTWDMCDVSRTWDMCDVSRTWDMCDVSRTWDMCDVSTRQVSHVKLYSPTSHIIFRREKHCLFSIPDDHRRWYGARLPLRDPPLTSPVPALLKSGEMHAHVRHTETHWNTLQTLHKTQDIETFDNAWSHAVEFWRDVCEGCMCRVFVCMHTNTQSPDACKQTCTRI